MQGGANRIENASPLRSPKQPPYAAHNHSPQKPPKTPSPRKQIPRILELLASDCASRKSHLQGSTRGPEAVRTFPLNLDISRVSAQVIEFQPGAPTTLLPAGRETVGVLYMLEGRLRLDSGGMHEVLETGDCACIDSEMPLAWSAADKSRCRVLAVLAAPQPRETEGVDR